MSRLSPAAALELLKPVTWFAPMWAFGCGVISAGSGTPVVESWLVVIAGIVLAGPLVCGTSQAVNDWYDREVDAINEPNRPIPSGRAPGRSGLYLAMAWTVISLVVAFALGTWVFAASVVGLVLAWLYSAPPARLKQNGWIGNLAVAFCYEGLPWFAGAALMLQALPNTQIIVMAVAYSLGAHGIMTFNDFKSVEGDLRMGIRSLPAQLGVDRAAAVSCATMVVAQIFVALALWSWGLMVQALVVAALTVGQIALVPRLMADPEGRAPWFNGTAVFMYVIGMLTSAFGVATLNQAG